MIGFATAPEADPTSCEVSLYELLVLLVPLVIAENGERCWEIAERTVSLGHDGRGDVVIRIEVPVASAHLGLGDIDPVKGKKMRTKRVKGPTP